MLIYKILRPAEWKDFESSGVFEGSSDDKRDGFIHCSSAEQAPATARRFFSGEPRLVVGVLDADQLGDAVRWEPAADGQHFPHVYRSLGREELVAVHEVAGPEGVEAVLIRE